MRFFLIDRITELVPHTTISATKNLSLAEEYLQDHFPGFPVMPGVLMLETLVQAGGWLIRHSEDFQHSVILMSEVKAIRFNNFVSPGNSLNVKLDVRKQEVSSWEFNGAGTVNGASAVSARLTLKVSNLADRNPELAVSDSERLEEYRQIFQQIWTPGQ